MLLIVLILHFLMIIAPSITAIDTPSSPILMLWIDTQYEILTFLDKHQFFLNRDSDPHDFVGGRSQGGVC
jgi:hypothetical protein